MTKHQENAFLCYAKYFIPTENKLAIISNNRKFKSLEDILKILIYILDSKNFNGERIRDLFLLVFDYQKEYYNLLVKLGAVNDKQSEQYNTLLTSNTIQDKSKKLSSLLNKIDRTEFNIFENIKTNNEFVSTDMSDKLVNNFKTYYKAYKKYEKTINDIKSEKKDSNLHSANPFIAEFHQFFTHFSYAKIAIMKQDKDKHDNFNYFVETNYDRGIKHLQRATLDIYKVIIVILIKNNKLTSANKLELIKTRQFEINNISLSFNKKINRYTSFLKKI